MQLSLTQSDDEVAIGDALPRILRGDAPAFAVRGVEDLTLPRGTGLDPATIAAGLEHAYCCEPRESLAAKTATIPIPSRIFLLTMSTSSGLYGTPPRGGCWGSQIKYKRKGPKLNEFGCLSNFTGPRSIEARGNGERECADLFPLGVSARPSGG